MKRDGKERALAAVLASALIAVGMGTSGCSSSGGDGTVSSGINEPWQHGGGAGDQSDVARHFPSAVVLADGTCANPDVEAECSDGDGCCPRNGVCCVDGSCAASLVSCAVVILATSGCPSEAPIECGAVCCGVECCSDGTCDACGDDTSANGQTSNPYDTSTGDDGSGSSTTDPGSGTGTDPGSGTGTGTGTGSGTSNPDPTPSCSDGQVVCGDSCCDSDSRGTPRPHAPRAQPRAASTQRATLTAPLFMSSSTAAK